MCIQLPSYIDNSGAVSQSVRETRARFGPDLGPTLFVCDKDFFGFFLHFALKVLVCFFLDAAGFCSHHPALNMFVI